MTLKTRTLTNAGDPLCASDGSPLGGIDISFQLIDIYGVPTDAWDAITHERVGGDPITMTTDVSGEFSVDLWPNSRGHKPTRYKCTVDHPKFKNFSGVIDDIEGSIQWVAFMAANEDIEPQEMGEIAILKQQLAEVLAMLDGGSAVTALSISSGVVNIDCALGDYFTLALDANVTSITFSNLPGSGKGTTKMIRITQDTTAKTLAWPASFKWAGASAGAVSTASGAVDTLAITTFDNGTSWVATLAKAFA